MSSLEDRMSAPILPDFDSRTKDALESIEASARKKEASGYAVMAMFAGYGDASQGDGWFGRVSRSARWFCIWFAMIVPVFLFWRVVL